MAYTIKVVRTRPNVDVSWSSPEIESLVEANEDIFETVDEEETEDQLTKTTTFSVDVIPSKDVSNEYTQAQKVHRDANGINRTVIVFDEAGNQIDSWED